MWQSIGTSIGGCVNRWAHPYQHCCWGRRTHTPNTGHSDRWERYSISNISSPTETLTNCCMESAVSQRGREGEGAPPPQPLRVRRALQWRRCCRWRGRGAAHPRRPLRSLRSRRQRTPRVVETRLLPGQAARWRPLCCWGYGSAAAPLPAQHPQHYVVADVTASGIRAGSPGLRSVFSSILHSIQRQVMRKGQMHASHAWMHSRSAVGSFGARRRPGVETVAHGAGGRSMTTSSQ